MYSAKRAHPFTGAKAKAAIHAFFLAFHDKVRRHAIRDLGIHKLILHLLAAIATQPGRELGFFLQLFSQQFGDLLFVRFSADPAFINIPVFCKQAFGEPEASRLTTGPAIRAGKKRVYLLKFGVDLDMKFRRRERQAQPKQEAQDTQRHDRYE